MTLVFVVVGHQRNIFNHKYFSDLWYMYMYGAYPKPTIMCNIPSLVNLAPDARTKNGRARADEGSTTGDTYC